MYKMTVIAFRANLTSAQSVPGSVNTKINFNATSFNVGGAFNTSTSQFMPTIPGYYSISALVTFDSNPAGSNTGVLIFKNGALYSNAFNCPGSAINCGATLTDVVPLDGVSDYLEIYAVQTSGGSLNADAAAFNTFVAGFLVYEIVTQAPSKC
jgi:C1q domain